MKASVLSGLLLALLMSNPVLANPDDVQKIRPSEAEDMGLKELGRMNFYNDIGEMQLERDMREWADSLGAAFYSYRKRNMGADQETKRARAVAYKAPDR